TVHHQARLVVGRIDLPELFNPDTVMLRIGIFGQVELFNQTLGEMTATAFSKNGVFGMQFITRSKVMCRFAILANAHVTGLDAFHSTICMIEDLSSSKAREDRYFQLFGFCA